MWWMGLIQAGVGMAQTIASAVAASNIGDRQAVKMSDAEKRAGSMAEYSARVGFSPAERAYFEKNLAMQQNVAKQHANSMGFPGAAIAGITGAQAMGEFASRNAEVKRGALGAYTNYGIRESELYNENARAFNNERAQAIAATSGGIGAGIGNMIGGLNSTSNAALTGKAIDAAKSTSDSANDDKMAKLIEINNQQRGQAFHDQKGLANWNMAPSLTVVDSLDPNFDPNFEENYRGSNAQNWFSKWYQ
jgi:hypothetical protein